MASALVPIIVDNNAHPLAEVNILSLDVSNGTFEDEGKFVTIDCVEVRVNPNHPGIFHGLRNI